MDLEPKIGNAICYNDGLRYAETCGRWYVHIRAKVKVSKFSRCHGDFDTEILALI